MDESSNHKQVPAERRAKRRFVSILVILGALTVVVLVRFAGLMLGDPQNEGIAGTPDVERGAILDRNGRILAIQTQLYTVSAWIPNVTDPEDTAAILASVLDLDRLALLERIQDGQGHLVIKRGAGPGEIRRLREEAGTDRLAGVSVSPQSSRTYPERELAAHVVGFVGVDNVGLDGIEYTLDPELSPPPAPQLAEASPTGDTVYGNQVFLTIDVNIQNQLRRLATDRLEQYQADAVMLLAMDAQNGEILGYVSVPDYDPNTFASYEPNQRRNRPISTIYEPGSVFKIYSIASILALGGIGDGSLFATNGIYDSIDPPIRDLGNFGTISTGGIIKYSSNVGAAYASDTVEAEPFYQMLRAFGFGSQTGVALNGEENGILQAPSAWSVRTKPTIAFGQEVGVTALQMITAATVLSNEGVLLEPQIIDKITSPEGRTVRENNRTPLRQVVPAEVADLMLRYMYEATLSDGTARRAAVEGINVSAKTGTAQMVDPATGTYSPDAFVASTLAIFPTEAPELIVYAVILRPRGDEYYGGRIAAPLVGDMIEYLADYMSVGVDTDRVVERPGRLQVTIPATPRIETAMPDFIGYSKRSLIPLLAREDLVIRIQGDGWVVEQDPPPGTLVESGSVITFRLE